MKKLYSYFRKRRDENNTLINIVKRLYAIGTKKWIHSLTVTVLSIIIPFAISNHYCKTSIALFFILLLDILFDYVCAGYQKGVYIERQFSDQMIRNQSSLMNSVSIEIQNNINWRKSIFKKTSEMVCEKIYSVFKYVLDCETRVSIEYVFNDNDKKEKRVKMAGRKSQSRETCKKSQALSKKRNYFSYKVFSSNKKGINILQRADIDNENVWYKNKSHNTTIETYFGIAISAKSEDAIDFILQIDCLDKLKLGDNIDTVDAMKDFINQYLMFYVHIITLVYCLNLNKHKEIGDV